MTSLITNKKNFLCKIAKILYRIEYKYSYIEKMFSDYIVDDDEIGEIVEISYTEEDIQRCYSMLTEEKSDAYIEYICILDKIAADLPSKNMLLMHGATIEYNGRAYVFTAPSGTGKSTHIALWKKYLKDKVQIINGDKPEISFTENEVLVHGAPWCGKEGWQINTSAPLAGVCLVKRGTENRISRINAGKNLEDFICQFYIGQGSEEMLKVIDLFAKMTERVPFYQLECTISEEAVRCSFEAMTGENWDKAISEVHENK